MDAKELHIPIICSVDFIEPVRIRANSKASAGLIALAERNHGERRRLVDHLIKLTGRGGR